jgi:SPP1 family phage portal protein
MDINKLLSNEDITTVITELKSGRIVCEPSVSSYKSQLDPSLHDVNDPVKRPNKKVRIDRADTGETTLSVTSGIPNEDFRYEPVARIALSIQKLIVKRAVAFTFGNSVILNSEPEDEHEETVLNAVKRVLFDTKSRTVNRQAAREIYSMTEAAELWYPVESPNEDYGFRSGYKLRVMLFSPSRGDSLYPYFDETGDMLAFSRQFTRRDKNGVDFTYFETYTDQYSSMWVQKSNLWELVEGYPKKNPIGKIPVVYGAQPSVEWADVQNLIDRLEKLLSNFSDTNDYHASPKIIVKGNVVGFSKKGESGTILQIEGDGEAKYLEWSHAPESVKLEIDTLLRMIYTVTQTPDISFDSVKGMGAISGIALKLLFLDAHLKVQEKMEVFDDYLQRRMSIIQSFIGTFNTGLSNACKRLVIEPEIVPYMIEDEQAKVDLLRSANGSKAIASQKYTIQRLGWATDVEEEYKAIQEEEAVGSMGDVFNPSM